MSIRFNHTLVYVRDKKKSAAFLTDILGLPPASPFGPFLVVELENQASLDFLEVGNTARLEIVARIGMLWCLAPVFCLRLLAGNRIWRKV